MSELKTEETKSSNEVLMEQIDEQVKEARAEKVLITDISLYDEFQCREKLDSSAVEDYTSIYIDAAETVKGKDWTAKVNKIIDALDPLVLFELNYKGKTRLVLVSGWHRLKSLKKAYKSLDPDRSFAASDAARVKIVKGRTAADAAVYAVHCNSKFLGARMQKKDYQKSIKNIFTANPSLSCRAIQVMINNAVSHTIVAKTIKSMKETGEVEDKESDTVVTRSGKEIKRKKTTGEKRGKKQMNGNWVPDNMLPIWKDSLLDSFVCGVESFIKALTAESKAHVYVPPHVISDLEKLSTVLTDSLPGNVCDECGGSGCSHCSGHGFLPRRECYGTEPEKQRREKPPVDEDSFEGEFFEDTTN